MTARKRAQTIPASIGADRIIREGGHRWANRETREVDSDFGAVVTLESWTLWQTNNATTPLDEATHHSRVKDRGVSRTEALAWCEVGDDAAWTLAAIVDAHATLVLTWRAIKQGTSYPLRDGAADDGRWQSTTELQNMMIDRARWLHAARLRLERPGAA